MTGALSVAEVRLHWREAAPALGVSTLCVEVLRETVRSEAVSTAEIADALGITQNAAWQQLRRLRAAKLVTQRRDTHPRGAGGISYWRADPTAIAAVLDDLFIEILGDLTG